MTFAGLGDHETSDKRIPSPMKGAERVFVVWTLAYMAVYLCVSLPVVYFATTDRTNPWLFEVIMPFHLLGMIQNFIALALTIRDLYKRDFPHPNDKLTWLLLILLTGGIGWFVYIFKHALKPRPGAVN